MLRAAAVPDLIRSRHPAGLELVFDPAKNIFKLHGQILTPISRIVDKVFPPFPRNKIAKQIAEREMKSVEEVLASWKAASILASNVEGRFATTLAKQPPRAVLRLHGEESSFYPEAERCAAMISDSFDVLATNAIVCSPQLKIAGKIDLVLREKRTKEGEEEQQVDNDNKLLLVTVKASASTLIQPFRFGSFDSPCNSPVPHLPNSKFTRHSLSLLMCGHVFLRENYAKVLLSSPTLKKNGQQREKSQVVKSNNNNIEIEYGILNIGRDSASLSVTSELQRVDPHSMLVAPDCGADGVSTPTGVLMDLVCNVL